MAAHENPDRRSRSSSVYAAVETFLCTHCGNTVSAEAFGTRQRNHCPYCLHSLHVDLAVGDRRSLCRGVMEPVTAWLREGGEVALIHRCTRCGALRSNRIAGDDDLEALRQRVARLGVALVEGQG